MAGLLWWTLGEGGANWGCDKLTGLAVIFLGDKGGILFLGCDFTILGSLLLTVAGSGGFMAKLKSGS